MTTKQKPNKTKKLIDLVLTHCELWQGKDNKGYATWKIDNHKENWRIHSSQFTQWIKLLYWETYADMPYAEAVVATKDLLESKAALMPYHKTYLRVARLDDHIYIDLGNKAWDCIEVSAQDGWKVISSPPVKFIRTNNTGELPLPERGGSIDLLKPLAGTTPENWIRVIGCLLDAFKGHSPYFVTSVAGPQGAAKTWLCKLLRQTTDPVKQAPLSFQPTDIRSLATQIQGEFCLAFDNVSYIPQWLSDALCSIATGGGFKVRTLYTDDELFVIDAACPIILNGIPQVAENNDLLSRTLLVEQPIMSEDKIRAEKDDLIPELERIKGKVLGAILDMLSNGLRNIGSVRLDKMPRMADSVKWITACFGNNDFIKAYADNEQEATEVGINASPIARGIVDMFKTSVSGFSLTASDLLKKLEDKIPFDQRGKSYPNSPDALGKRLQRDKPALLKMGIVVERVTLPNSDVNGYHIYRNNAGL